MRENNYIIGIDLGNLTTAISYYDFNQKKIETVDASGGYGKFTIPTVVSYNLDFDSWAFGEYALLNKGFETDIVFENIIQNLGKNNKYNIKDEKFSISYILSKFFFHLIENIKNINPNANINGIVISCSYHISKEAIYDLKEALKLANLYDKLISIVDERECAIREYFFNNIIDGDKILLIDYGNRKLKVSLYKIEKNNKLLCIKTDFNEDIGQNKLFQITKDLITKKFMEGVQKINISHLEQINLENFATQQLDFIFQRNNISDIKLYYNFHYPPFQKIIKKEEIFNIIYYFEREINIFFQKFFKDININENEIKNFILCGGGLEIDFIQKLIKSKFSIKKNFKGIAKKIISYGACIIACQEKNILPKDYIEIQDFNKLKNDIGIFIKKEEEFIFFTLIKKDTYILEETKKYIFNLVSFENLDFNVYLKDEEGYKIIKNIKIDLPKNLERDLRTIRLLVQIEFIKINQLLFSIQDFGFGEIFPKTDFKKQFLIDLFL